jgi:hypothetical protein
MEAKIFDQEQPHTVEKFILSKHFVRLSQSCAQLVGERKSESQLAQVNM